MSHLQIQKQWKMTTPLGELYLGASARGLTYVYWNEREVPMAKSLNGDDPVLKILDQAAREFEEYFAGDRRSFDVALDVNGTEFQKSVWDQLKKIPYGQTCSYSDIARRLKNDGAVRAVGTANGRNPVSVIVPCHRVIAADGTLGGYSGGLGIKAKLLKLEGSDLIG